MRESLFAEHLEWAEKIGSYRAGTSRTKTQENGEILNAARFGLWDATAKWEPGGATFRTYAKRRIMGAITDRLREMSPVCRTQHADGIRAFANLSFFEQFRDPDGSPLVEGIASERFEQPGDRMAAEEEAERILRTIPEHSNMRKAMRLYALEGLSLNEIGEMIGKSESRVCQLVALAARIAAPFVDPSRPVFKGRRNRGRSPRAWEKAERARREKEQAKPKPPQVEEEPQAVPTRMAPRVGTKAKTQAELAQVRQEAGKAEPIVRGVKELDAKAQAGKERVMRKQASGEHFEPGATVEAAGGGGGVAMAPELHMVTADQVATPERRQVQALEIPTVRRKRGQRGPGKGPRHASAVHEPDTKTRKAGKRPYSDAQEAFIRTADMREIDCQEMMDICLLVGADSVESLTKEQARAAIKEAKERKTGHRRLRW